MNWSLGNMYIDGQWMEAESGQRFEVLNPANGQLVGTMPDGGAIEAKLAVDAAHRAFPAWSMTTAMEKSKFLYRWYELVSRNARDIAEILTQECGKPIKEALAEMAYGADFILWYAEEAKRNYGKVIPSFVPNKQILSIQRPLGVAAAITPWNFPCAMVTRKLAPALAAGCTVVLKPAEQTPLTSLALVKLAEEAGIPKGVINLVTGMPAEIGQVLLTDTRVRKISFTGSNEVGKLLLSKSADHMKRVSLELGGNAPFIVFDDADLDKAVQGAMATKFRNAGQTCVCANRFYVQEGIAEAFTGAIVERVSQLKVGDGSKEDTDIGPLIDQSGLDKVERHVADAIAKGAIVQCGGTAEGGFFYKPTVLSGIRSNMLVAHEETFGPIVPIQTFRREEEAISLSNHPTFGLSAYVYTNDLSRAVRMYEALEYGMVGVNDSAISTVQVPFGGMKESGLGREGGTWGMEAYLETKYISMGL